MPKGTPREVVARLNAAVMDALANPVVRQRLADLGQEIFPRSQQTPEALAAFQKAERSVVAHYQGRQYQGGVTGVP